MFTLHFDCQHIDSDADFYRQLRQQYAEHRYFGDSLDALWDWLTGEFPLPMTCYFHHINPQQLTAGHPLAAIVALFFEAKEQEPDLYQIILDQADS